MISAKRIAIFLGLTVAILFGLLPAEAQRTEGAISGQVTDPEGAAIANARIIVTSLQTGAVREVKTNEQGVYRVPHLRPGAFDIRIEASGFKSAVLRRVEVQVNKVTRADATLEVGALEQAVVVEAGVRPLINTEEARISESYETRQVEELPLVNREIYQLPTLLPGVVSTETQVISNVPSSSSAVTFNFTYSANGATPRGNNYVMDGTTNNNEWLGGTPVFYPSPDFIGEFEVQTLNFAAEYGRNNGSVVNIVTKSGTNEIHGSAFWFHQNKELSARNFFDPADKPQLIGNNFGFSLGGPIRRDSTFFFTGYQGLRRRDGLTQIVTSETPQFRQQVATQRPGSFANQFLQDFPGPACIGNFQDRGSIPDPLFGPFAIGPADGVPDTCTAAFASVQGFRSDQLIARVDHLFVNGRDKIFGRWIFNDVFADVSREESFGAANVRGFEHPLEGLYSDISLGWIHSFSPTMINDFRFAWLRNDTFIGFDISPGQTLDQLQGTGQPNNFIGTLFFDDGVATMGGSVFIPRTFVFNTFTWADTLTHVVGRHSLRYGFEIRRVQENSNYELETRPFYDFNSIFNFANDDPWLLDALVNRNPASPGFGNFGDTPRNFRWTHWAWFIQDDWKIRPNFTLNLGLRYEIFGVPTEENGILANIILGSGAGFFEQLANARVGRVDELFDDDFNNFSPRIGIAWDPWGDGKTAVRAGFAMMYVEPYSNLYTNASRFDPPDTTFLTLFPFLGVGTDINYTFPHQPSPDFSLPPTPTNGVPGLQIGVSGTFDDLRTAYTLQWMLSVQRELFRDYGLTLSYTGTRGVKLYLREDWNRVDGDLLDFVENRRQPEWGQIFYVTNASDSDYHGLSVQLQKNYSHGFMFTANYTWSHMIDIISGGGLGDFFNATTPLYTGTQSILTRDADRGDSDWDVRHRFTITGLWDIPAIQTNNPVGQKLLGGWQINSIVTLQTGRPVNVFCTLFWFQGCDFNLDGLENDRPNNLPGLDTEGFSTQDYVSGIFGVSDFCPGGLVPFFLGTPCVPAGSNGTLPRNAFRGPGRAQVDLAIFKNTYVAAERVNLQFRAEIFNIFNRVNLFLPSGNMASPFFGQSTRAFPSRQIQLGLRLVF